MEEISESEIQRSLEFAGLSRVEAKTYITLLKLGESKAGQISKQSHLNRTTTYDTLDKLIEKGLVSYVIKENRKYFQAADPKNLNDFIEEKKEEISNILPHISKLFKSKETHHVKLFYGYKGVKTALMDEVRNAKECCILDSEGQLVERMPYFVEYFRKQLEKNKIKIRHIAREGRDIRPTKYTKVKFVQKSVKSQAVVSIYGNKTLVLIWSEPPEAVLIENRTLADSLREYFDMLWKIQS